MTLIVFVTAVFLFLAANRFEGELFQVSVVAVGTVALVTAITGFLIASAETFDEMSQLK